MLARVNLTELEQGLDRAILPADQIILLYSGIWTLGARIDVPARELPRRLIDAILHVLGPARTLVLPTYTYSYTRSRRYDPAATVPETGVLPIELLGRPKVIRTPSALNSYAAVGPDAEELATVRGATLWGAGSVMEWLERHNARICVLGLPWERACSFFHRTEELARVPYRYYKRFPGIWLEGGRERPWTETMYVRTLSRPSDFRWALVSDAVRASGRMRLGSRPLLLESALAKDVTAAGLALLEGDPYALLSNAADLREWVRSGKTDEIAALPPDERG